MWNGIHLGWLLEALWIGVNIAKRRIYYLRERDSNAYQGGDMLQPQSGRAARNERKYLHIAELAVATDELDFQLSRRIIDFHKLRHIETRHGRRVVRESQIYYRWCFSDLVTACDFAEQFGGELLASENC
jgi:hypothetical protein